MKQPLFRDWRRLLFVVIASLIASAAAAAGPGYLALVGPAPLRFFPLPQVPTNRFVLPVPAPAPEPARVAPQIEMGPPAPPPQPAPAPAPAPAAQPPTSDAAQPSVGTAPPDGVISPQMLLKYFNKSTNNPASVVAPMDFALPKAAEPQQSSATYSTSP